MNLKAWLWLVMAAVVAVASAGISRADSEVSKLAADDNDFSFRLLKQIAAERPHGTVFVSPYSAATALQMAANGAAGQTRSEMEQVLGTAALNPAELRAECQAASRLLAATDTNLILTTANALWYRQESTIRPDFLAGNQAAFGSALQALDFRNVPGAEAAINQWASDQTHGRITGIANGLIDPLYTDLVLANAIYFKGKWMNPFDPGQTKPRLFHPATGTGQMRDMMEMTEKFSYRKGTGYGAVRIPYKGGEVAMYVLLPDPGSSLEKLLGILNGDRWRRVTVPGFSEHKVHLVLPKFKLEDTLELKNPLLGMGMKTPFDRNTADFSRMFSDRHFVSEVRQKTFVQVDEKGTEAAAVTDVMFETNGIPAPEPPPIEMIVDRPFLFAIVDGRSGLILFLGWVNEL